MKEKNKPYPYYQLDEIHDLKELLELQVEKNPDVVAFSMDQGKNHVEITRKEFFETVRQLVNGMKKRHWEKEKIAIIAPNSIDWLLAFFAIVLSGNIAVPIDKEGSPKDIQQMLAIAECSKVFYKKGFEDFLEGLDPSIEPLPLESLAAYKEEKEDYYSAIEIDPNTVCAFFFTSGTTGIPKAVMLSHKNLAADINLACKNFKLDGNTVSILPFHHCFGLNTAILKVFHYGKSTHIVSSLRRFPKSLQTYHPQTLFLVPLFVETFHKRILKTLEKEGLDKKVIKLMKASDVLRKLGIDQRDRLFKKIKEQFGENLQYIICGGAMLDQKYIDDFRSWGIEILNGYGITECSPVVSVNRNHFKKPGSVGQVLDSLKVKTNDEGEILIAGDIVMEGYYHNQEESDKVLQAGWFNTQDLGYVDKDGFLFLEGRKKNLIILSNGENISPEQIEMELTRNKGIKEIIVYSKNQHLEAQIVPDEGYAPAYFEKAISEYNHKQPQAKQIAHYSLRDQEFEKTPTKKILRYKVTGEK